MQKIMQQNFYVIRASHDFTYLRCSTQSVKCYVLTLFLHFTFIHIGFVVCNEKSQFV